MVSVPMAAEPWILKKGSQVSTNLKHALLVEPSEGASKKQEHRDMIGILSFEVANVMSKIAHLHKFFTHREISKLKSHISNFQGVKYLVSSDESYLLELALSEKLDDLDRVAGVVARLGKKCTAPVLQGFDHVYGDIASGAINVKDLGFLAKDMEAMMRKMERYVNSTANLYGEMEVLGRLELATKKFQQNHLEESRTALQQKLAGQKQDVSDLKDVSLWNQRYDKVVEMLARTVCTIYSRVASAFGDDVLRLGFMGPSVSGSQFAHGGDSNPLKGQPRQKSGQIGLRSNAEMSSGPLKTALSKSNGNHSEAVNRAGVQKKGANLRAQLTPHRDRGEALLFRPEDFHFLRGTGRRRPFTNCLCLSSSSSKVDDEDDDASCGHDDGLPQASGCTSAVNGLKREQPNGSGCLNGAPIGGHLGGEQRQAKSTNVTRNSGLRFGPKSRLTAHAAPSTVGGSALALHYANVVIVIEKLLRYPHLVGEEARDDLYQMLPSSLRVSLKANLKSCLTDLAIYDAAIAHDWKEKLEETLGWLAPLAHNMIRWHSERTFEQQQIDAGTNILLLDTLYFADRTKTEAAICELLVGLNYICRYEHQQTALLDCASSFDFDDCMNYIVGG